MASLPSLRRCKAAHLAFGRRGEAIAERLVRSLGMVVLCRNYEGPRGEIDLVALDGSQLCFIEVKARKPRSNSRPADAVTLKKKWALVQTARHYLRQLNQPKLTYRFDVVEVIMTHRRLVELRYWPSDFVGDEVQRMMRAR